MTPDQNISLESVANLSEIAIALFNEK